MMECIWIKTLDFTISGCQQVLGIAFIIYLKVMFYIAASIEGEVLYIHQVFGKEHIEIKRLANHLAAG